jgi:outer membrane protein TolC
MKIKSKFLVYLFLFTITVFPQNNLSYYLSKGLENSPALKEIQNSEMSNKLQSELNYSQTSAPQVYLSANYLFAPYFNNNGKILSTNPDPKAIGYDVGITNGGLYSAQINIEKNIFNGGLTNALDNQIGIQQKQFKYNYDLGKKNLQKQITDQYLTAYKSMLLFSLSKEVLQNVEDQLKITSDLVEKGFANSQSYLLLKIELQTQQIALGENLQQYKSDLLQLNSICGIKDTQTVFIDSVQVKMISTNKSFDFLEKFSLDSLAVINQQNLFETKYQPQVKIFFNTGLNAVELDGIQRKFGLSAGVDFQLPILDGGQKDLTRQQNLISISSISGYKNYTSANIDNQIKNSITNINLIKNNLNKINDQLNDYNQLIKISDKQLNSGDISMIDYLSILRNFIDLRKNKIEKEIALQTEINNYNYWTE